MDLSRSVSTSTLRDKLDGRIIVPADPDYDEARALFMGGFDRHPAIIVRAASAADVQHAVRFARESGLELAVRSGGHSGAGHSTTDGGIVLDLRDMKAIDVDVERRTASAEAGLTAAEYSTAVAAYGMATGFGDTGSVGIGGITVGGGIGYLARKHGLTIDSLLAADVVTADGQLRHVDEESEPDLFWAIRGGGGNFGVVTRFTFRLHPVGQIVGGMLLLPATPEVVAGMVAEADRAPEELSVIANVMPCPPMPFVPEAWHGKLGVMALMCYAGESDAGARAIAPFRALAEPIVDMVRPMTYPELFPPEDASYHPTAVSRAIFLRSFDVDAAKTVLDYLQASDASMRVMQLRVLGGAIARVAPDATAYAHRRAPIMAVCAAFYVGEADRPVRERWMNALVAALDQGEPGRYVNFMGLGETNRVRDAYPARTWERLAAIKRTYDPDNLFRLNHNVPPARA